MTNVIACLYQNSTNAKKNTQIHKYNAKPDKMALAILGKNQGAFVDGWLGNGW